MSRGRQSQKAASCWVWTEREPPWGLPHTLVPCTPWLRCPCLSLSPAARTQTNSSPEPPSWHTLKHFAPPTCLSARERVQPLERRTVLCQAGDEGSHHLGSFIHSPGTGLGFAGLLEEISTQHGAMRSSPTRPRRGHRRSQVLSAGTTRLLTSREARRSSGQPVFPSSRRGLRG